MYRLKKGAPTTFEHFATVWPGTLPSNPLFGRSIALSKVGRRLFSADCLIVSLTAPNNGPYRRHFLLRRTASALWSVPISGSGP